MCGIVSQLVGHGNHDEGPLLVGATYKAIFYVNVGALPVIIAKLLVPDKVVVTNESKWVGWVADFGWGAGKPCGESFYIHGTSFGSGDYARNTADILMPLSE